MAIRCSHQTRRCNIVWDALRVHPGASSRELCRQLGLDYVIFTTWVDEFAREEMQALQKRSEKIQLIELPARPDQERWSRLLGAVLGKLGESEIILSPGDLQFFRAAVVLAEDTEDGGLRLRLFPHPRELVHAFAELEQHGPAASGRDLTPSP